MERYMKLNDDLAKRQLIEKITLELVYEFLILNNKDMKVFKVDDVNVIDEKTNLELYDEAISNLNKRTKLELYRKKNIVYVGNCSILDL